MNQELEEMLSAVPELPLQFDTREPSSERVGEKPEMKQVTLSPDEEKIVKDFAAKIDLENSNMILKYGAGAQKKIADFSESALDSVRTRDLGEVGQILTDVVSELKSFEIEEEDKGFFGFFKRGTNRLELMKVKYDKADATINKIRKVLETHQIDLLKDIHMLDKMYELNNNYFKELSMYVMAGKMKLEKTRGEDLPVMLEKAQDSGLQEDVQAANDLASLCNRFEKKIHDLELTRMISIQMAPQIRLVQENDMVMSEKIQSTIVNTIPLWKSQMVLAIGISHSETAAKAQREVTDMTNELLQRNAQALKTATIETARESERGIVDMETLKLTNESLISTLDEVVRIQLEGRERRKTAEEELCRLEGELKQKLLDMSK